MTGTGSGTGPGDASSGPDDINNRLAEIAAELASEAKFKELSAAERAKRARRAGKQPRRARRGRDARPSPPSGQGKRGRTTSLLITVAVIAALIGASFGISRLHLIGHGTAKPDNTPVTGDISPAPLRTVAPAFSSTDPFAGSPAESYADGASGIVIPAARAVGSYSPAQVRAAYVTVRKLLIAGYLNTAVLAGGSPTAFARLLAPGQRSFFKKNLSSEGLDKNGDARSTRSWVTSFAPGTTEQVGHVIKVHGQMTAAVQRSGHVRTLGIHADYLFVYPVQQEGGQASTRMRIVARAAFTVLFAPWDDPGGPLQPWITGNLGGTAGILCVYDGYVHPAFPGGPQSSAQPSGKPINPYDQSAPASEYKGCKRATGT